MWYHGLYKSLVRPNLEYFVQAWSPYLRQDIDTLEQIQKRASKMMRTGKIDVWRKIDEMWINKFEKDKKRGDLIEAYKIITGKEAISAHKFFKIRMESRIRGHRYKI